MTLALRRSLPIAAAAALAGLCSVAARGEPPARSALAADVLYVQYTFFGLAEDNGIMRLSPDSLEHRRLRPFVMTKTPAGTFTPGFAGGEGFLTAHGDTLSYRSWPAVLDFDLFSLRLIRRLPAAVDAEEYGRVVAGPTLGAEEAAALGLAPGTYGYGRCAAFGISGFRRLCPEWPAAGPASTPAGAVLGSDEHLLFRPRETPVRPVEIVADLEFTPWSTTELSYQYLPAPLSFDLGRGGLWRGRSRGVDFHPTAGGAIGPPSRALELATGVFDAPNVELHSLVYHAPSGSLFGTAFDYTGGSAQSRGYVTFRADPDSGVLEALGEWTGGRSLGSPFTWAAAGMPPASHEQTVPIVAAGPGRRGTHWSTELWLYNPSAATQTVTLRRVTRPDQGRVVVIPGRGSLGVDDVLGFVGGGPGGDGTGHEALVVTAESRWGEELVVGGRISTADPVTGGRFGHAVPAVPGRVGYSNHIQYLRGEDLTPDGELNLMLSTAIDPSFLDLDLAEPGRFRANLGVVNDLDHEVRLRLVWGFAVLQEDAITRTRPPGSVVEVVAPPHSVRIFPLLDLFSEEVVSSYPPRIAVAGDTPAVVWLSVVDNRTGDASFVPFTTFQLDSDSLVDRLVIPAVASAPGRNGSFWRTDVYAVRYVDGYWDGMLAGYRPGDPETACGGAAAQTGVVQQDVYGRLGTSPEAWAERYAELTGHPLSIPAASWAFLSVYDDVVRRFRACQEETDTIGALEVAVGNWTAGWSRTYTTRPDGGTYGGMLPFYPPGGWPVQHFAGLEVNADQRVNVGLYNGIAEHPVTHRLLLYAADGALAAVREVTLEPHQHLQAPLAGMLALPPGSLADGLYGLTVIPLDDPEVGLEGRSWAYVSIVDNRTNDPVNLW